MAVLRGHPLGIRVVHVAPGAERGADPTGEFLRAYSLYFVEQFDPRYGVLHEFHTTDNQGFQTYRPPSDGPGHDWVLLLEAVK